MSKFHAGVAALGLSLVLTIALPSAVEARGFGIGIGGGPIGVVRSVASMIALRHMHGRHGRRVRMANDRMSNERMANEDAGRASSRVDMTRSPDWIVRPVARVQLAAGAALAGWHAQRGTKGWWAHGDGGYGWVGPLFWPFAYYDIIDYTFWGDGMGFWGYGYRDIYAAIFTPYDENELAGYMTPARHHRPGRLPSLAQICGDDFSELARLPVEQIRGTIRSSEEQRAALDELANAASEAAQAVSATCPTQAATTAPARLKAMQTRLEAMQAAIARLRNPFETFWEMLDDDQKAQLKAFSGQRAPFAPKVPAAQSCTPPDSLPWPAKEIEARLHLNDEQRVDLAVLQHMSGLASNTMNLDCQPDENLDPPDRLATAETRIEAMLDAVKQVAPALGDFLNSLNDEQKAQFESIGAKRTS
jgi:LTXXQ motif family protein